MIGMWRLLAAIAFAWLTAGCLISTQEFEDVLGDVDGDGLDGYQENKWGTDPSNPDTDGYGR